MTDTPKTPQTSKPSQWLEIGPVAIFVIVYQFLRRSNPDGAIYTAAGIFMVLAIAALFWSRAKHGIFPKVLLLTTVIIVISVGLAFFFQDPRFIYMKPTVVNILFGAAVLGGVFLKKNVLKIFIGEALDMPDKAWNTLAIRWGIFFFVLAAINEFVWRNYSEDFWVNFKLLGFMPITFLFLLSQAPFLMKHGNFVEEKK